MGIHHDPVISYGHVRLANEQKRQPGESKEDFFVRCAEQVYGSGRREFVGFGKYRRLVWVYQSNRILGYDQHTRLALWSRLIDLLVYGDRSDDRGYMNFEVVHESRFQELRRSYGFVSVYRGEIEIAIFLLFVFLMTVLLFYLESRH